MKIQSAPAANESFPLPDIFIRTISMYFQTLPFFVYLFSDKSNFLHKIVSFKEYKLYLKCESLEPRNPQILSMTFSFHYIQNCLLPYPINAGGRGIFEGGVHQNYHFSPINPPRAHNIQTVWRYDIILQGFRDIVKGKYSKSRSPNVLY